MHDPVVQHFTSGVGKNVMTGAWALALTLHLLLLGSLLAQPLCYAWFVAERSRELRFPMGTGIAGHVATTGETLNIDNAYRDSRLRAFTPVEFRQRFKVEKMDAEKLVLHKLWDSAARYISAWWRLKDRRGRAAAYEQRLYDVAEMPMAVEMTSSDDESELEDVLKQAKGKRDDLYKKLKVVYKHDLRELDAVSNLSLIHI